jgi:hypothetical protein
MNPRFRCSLFTRRQTKLCKVFLCTEKSRNIHCRNKLNKQKYNKAKVVQQQQQQLQEKLHENICLSKQEIN